MKNIFFIALVLFSLASCQKPAYTPPPGHGNTVDTVYKDLSYGSDAQQKLDLYLPAGRTDSTPVIILIHGGGWKEGNKAELSFFGKKFHKKHFVVANVNYRLAKAGKENFKNQMDDIASVIAFLNQHTDQYVYSDKRAYLIGHSAGGHLSLSYAYTRNQSGQIKAAAGMAAPTNLFHMAYYNTAVFGDLLTEYLGKPLSSATESLYTAASPYYQATATSPPTILFQGDLDIIVNKDQATSLAGKLNQLKVKNKLVIYPFIFHDWWTNGDLVNNTVDEAARWFDTYR